MSQYTLEQLNAGDILVGMDHGAWWKNDGIIAALGIESPFYTGPIPIEDVRRRIFNWSAESRQVAYLVPCSIDAEYRDADGMGYRVVMTDRQGISRSDTDQDLGCFKSGYQVHQYGDALLDKAFELVDADIGTGIETAGILGGGVQAFLTIGISETIEPVEGFKVYPRLLVAASHDGTLAVYYKVVDGIAVCDNTMAACLGEASPQVKVKHSRYSKLHLDNARAALGFIERHIEISSAAIKTLAETVVTLREWDTLLDALVPVSETPGRGATLAETKRGQLSDLYNFDDRCSPWKNSALGVLQAFNTWDSHFSIVKGGNRVEKQWGAVLSGTQDEKDSRVLATLRTVLA